MSWLSVFYKGNKNKLFIRLIIKGLKYLLGNIANDLYELIIAHVREAEKTDKTGKQKFELVYKGVKENLGDMDVKDYFINFLIEAAVISLNEKS